MTRTSWIRSRLQRVYFPRVDQTDAADCGPASLLAVLRFWGGNATLGEVRSLAGTGPNGASLAGLARAARALGLDARAAAGSYEALRSVRTPCIAHLVLPDGLGHFVVVRGVGRRYVRIADPARRIRSLSRAAFETAWKSGAVLLVDGSEPAAIRRVEEEPWFAWVARYGAHEPGWLAQSLFLGAVSAAAGLLTALFIRVLVDRLIPLGDLSLTLTASGALLSLLLGKAAIDYARSRFLIRLGRSASSRTTRDLLIRLFSQDSAYFRDRPVGDLTARVRDGVPLHRGTVEGLGVVLIEGLTLGGSVVLLLAIAPQLALITLVVLPLHGVMVGLRAERIRRGHERALGAVGIAESELSDGLRGAGEIGLLGVGSNYAHKVDTAFDGMLEEIQSLEGTRAGLRLVSGVSGSLLMVSALFVGAAQVVDGRLLLGELMAGYSLLAGAIGSVNRAVGGLLHLQEMRVAAHRARALTGPGARAGPARIPRRVRRGLRLRFTEPPSFGTVDGPVRFLEFPVGVPTGLSGPTGVGKSTLIRMLAGDGLPGYASLTADGRRVDDLCVRVYRTRVAVVPRAPHVFRGTLGFNVTLDRPGLDGSRTSRWLASLGLSALLDCVPFSWTTPVGEGIRAMSTGERQVVGVMRALAGRPDVLLIDEGLSGMDAALRESLITALLRFCRSRVLVIVSHDPSILGAMQRVVRLTPSRPVVDSRIARAVAAR